MDLFSRTIEINGNAFTAAHIEVEPPRQSSVEMQYLDRTQFMPGVEEGPKICLYVTDINDARGIEELLGPRPLDGFIKQDILIGDTAFIGCFLRAYDERHCPNDGTLVTLNISCDKMEIRANVQPPAKHITLDLVIGEIEEIDPEDRIMGTRKLDL